MKKLCSVVGLLLFIESVVTQAPGDGSELCLPGGAFAFLRFPIPENMKVLLESRDYETLLGNQGEPDTWQQVDVDGLAGAGSIWTQQGDQGCRQVVIVCGFHTGQQNNWLITQHISRQTTTLLPQVTVIVEYEFSDCSIVLNCARTFSIWKYDSSTIDATLARDTSKYTPVANIAPEDTSGNVRQNETIEIDFSGSETGFYLAIRDEGSCLLIHRVLVFYYVCPGMTENLIIYPEILAPPISPTSPPINVNNGRCVPNAATTGGGNPILTCSQGGIWSIIVNCTCNPGFSMNADGTACIVAELDLSFTGDSPRLGIGTIIAELFTNRPGVQIICFLRRTTFTQDCSNGSVTFANVPAGGYILQVVATDRETGNRAEIRTRVFVPESDEFCSVNAINRLVSVSGNSASVEFSSTGNPTGFQCSVDRQSYFLCTSPVAIAGLDSGRHRLRVRPRGCGRPGSGHKSLSATFTI